MRKTNNTRRSVWKIVAGGACAASLALPAIPAMAQEPTTPVDFNTATSAEQILNSMTLDQKIGQILWTHVYGSSADDETYAAQNQAVFGEDVKTPAQAVAKYNLGGVLYFNWSYNVENKEQLRNFSAGLQQAASKSGAVAPLAITIDQEGGIVARVREGATDFPGAMALGATGNEQLAEQEGRVLGSELAAMGVNVDFAPDADVNTNPANPVIGVRSLGDDAATVGKLVAAQVRGLQSELVAATAKHFPGHGDTQNDSHFGLPRVSYDRATLDTHLAPFKAAMDADVDMIMTAHIIVDAIDSEHPATLSKKVLTGLLRNELGYKGLIVTDALDMEGAQLSVMTPDEEARYRELKTDRDSKAAAAQSDPTLADQRDVADAALKEFLAPIRGRVVTNALNAGADVLLNVYDAKAATDALREGVQNGTIAESRLNDAVTRVLNWKLKRLRNRQQPDLSVVGSAEHLAVADNIARESVTLLRNQNNVLPLDPACTPKVLVTGASYANPEFMPEAFKAAGFTPTFVELPGYTPQSEDIDKAVAAARDNDVIVVTTYNLAVDSVQQDMIAKLVATGKPVIMVSGRNPYDLANLAAGLKVNDVNAVSDALPAAALATYSNRPASMKAVVQIIAGTNPTGTLPVNVPNPASTTGALAFARGFGLHYASAEPDPDTEQPNGDQEPEVKPDESNKDNKNKGEKKNQAKKETTGKLATTGAEFVALMVVTVVLLAGAACVAVIRRRA